MDAAWDHYQTLLAVLDAGSLSGAARRLRISQPTAGRHIEQLEAALGLPLFTRSPSGLRPTGFALQIRDRLEAMSAAAAAIARDASGETEDTSSGVVRITTSDVLGVEVLPPILAELMSANPGLEVELHLSNAPEDLLRREADIAVRTFRPAQGALVARRVGVMPIRLYVHRRYVERRGMPDRMDAPGHVGVGYDRDPQAARMAQSLGLGLRRDSFQFRADNQLAQLAAIRAGVGVGPCQAGIAARDPDLLALPDERFRLDMEIWVAMHEDLKTSRRIRLVFDALAEALGAYVATVRD